ncbi:glycosyltransferase [Streptococcus uberis]|uniref:Glycosyl transferase n=1 Tax=Streptococcus uberis (strain ATCC BAA-854 / 0140J) TaxID=218495 RepID=B9DUI8_STRU0|nr:glycosyltransferase [Streptococcus uberis]CAR42306.1 putative glycosyl transferase [Streptococcus uberis 0140J]
MKKKLSVLTLYTKEGASSNYRVLIFKEKFEENFEVQYSSFWNRGYSSKYMHNKKKYILQIIFSYFFSIIRRLWHLYFIIPKTDILLIQKAVIPKLKPTFLKHLKRKKIRIVFDVDDAIYLLKNDNSQEIAKNVDLIICGNDNLRTYYSQYNKNCVVLPTTDNTNKYKPYWDDTFNNKTIGWIGSRTTIKNLHEIVKPINQLVEKYPQVSFKIISNDALDFPKIIKNTKLIKWSSDTYLEDLSQLTVGIMPLKDDEFNRGKCGFKLIQYLNMKKPVVGSNVGVNGEIINNNGFVVNDIEDWFKNLETLLFNQEEYNNCQTNIENNFFSCYHFDIVSEKLIRYLKYENS